MSATGDPFTRIAATEATAQGRSEGRYSSLILELESPDTDTKPLTERGIVIWGRRGELVLAYVPESLLPVLDDIPGIGRASVARPVSASMDVARAFTGADAVAAGTGLPAGYTGRGVSVGFSDSGFDPGHIAFAGRLRGAWHYCDSTASISPFAAGETDNTSMTHATHVANILAGGDMSAPYNGAAPGASIVATTSGLHDVEILAGVERVIASAREAGEPAVVNLSLGTVIGPHDGSDLFCRYLDRCAEEAAILLSAGNDGMSPVSATHTFTSATPTVKLMYDPTDWDRPDHLICSTDIWGDDPSPIDVRFIVWNILDMAIEYTTPWVSFTGTDDNSIYELSADTDPEWGRYFSGKCLAAAEVNPANNRYNVAISHRLANTEKYPDKTFGLRLVVIEIRGQDGSTADICVDGTATFHKPVAAIDVAAGDAHLSISSMACGHNTMSVGMWTSRDVTPAADGGSVDHSGFVQAGSICPYSSWGTVRDGRSLPHFSAPGAMIVSAMSAPYLAANPGRKADIAAYSKADPTCAYYADCGTSMAAPLAAGIMALWLEADPTLTPAELRDIAVSTARTDGTDPLDPRTGAGIIDAVAGLRKILGSDGRIDAVAELVRLYRRDGRLETEGFDPATMRIEVYGMDGRPVRADALPAGPVVVKIITEGGVSVKKLL